MKQKTFQSIFFFSALIGVLLLAGYIILPFVGALLLAAVFAVMLLPIYEKLLGVLRGRRAVAAGLLLLLVFAAVLVPVTLLGGKIFQESRDFYILIRSDQARIVSNFQHIWEQQKFLSRYLPEFPTDFSSLIEQVIGWLVAHLGGFFSGTLQVLLSVFVGIIAFYYFLKDGPAFLSRVMVLSPLPDAYDRQILSRIQLAITSVVRGSLLIAGIQGFVSGIGYAIFGVPGAAFLGVITAIGALVPGIGTAAVIFPVILFLFLSGKTAAAIGLLCWGVVAVGLIDNMLGPRFVGQGLRIHPFFVLLSVLGGVTVFGPFGIVVGPMVLALLFAFLDLYSLIVLRVGKAAGKKESA